MAQLFLNEDLFDQTEASNAREFKPVPTGWYYAMITNSDYLETRKRDGHYLKVEFTLYDWADVGPVPENFANRKVWANLNLVNPNPKAVEIAYADLKAIKQACGIAGAGLTDSSVLHEKPLEIYVVPKKGDGEYATDNDVKGYRPAGTGKAARLGAGQTVSMPAGAAQPPGAGGAVDPVVSTAAQQATSTVPPWQRQ